MSNEGTDGSGSTTSPTVPGSGPALDDTGTTSPNPTTGSTSGLDETTASSSETGDPPSTFPPDPTPTVFPSAEHRIDNWTPSGPWEMAWEADASAADLPRPFHTWFDNPHDDDLNAYPSIRGACRYRFDDPAAGMMTVDRVNTPDGPLCPLSATGYGGRTFTGNVWSRDPYLSPETGLTLEVDVDIPDKHIQIQDEAFVMMAVLPHGSFAVYLSPSCVKIGRVKVPQEATRHACASTPDASARALVTEGQHRYRMTLAPDSLDVTLYVNDDPEPFLLGTGNPLPFTRLYAPGLPPELGDAEYEHPYILIGDNTGSSADDVAVNEDVSAAYVLDGIRWTRGVFTPTDAVAVPDEDDGPFRRRWPPALPANEAIEQPGLEFDEPLPDTHPDWVRALTGDAATGFTIGTLDGDRFVPTDEPPPGEGVLRIDEVENGAYLHQHLEGLLGNGAWALEARIRMDPSSTPRAFALNLWDQIGMVNLLLSADRVELALGGKFRGYSDPIELDTTDDFHTYRIVRKQNDHLVYLFVDDIERPAVADFSMSGVQMNGPYRPMETRLWFGYIGQVFPSEWIEQGNGEFLPYADVNVAAFVDHIRWTTDVPLGEPL